MHRCLGISQLVARGDRGVVRHLEHIVKGFSTSGEGGTDGVLEGIPSAV